MARALVRASASALRQLKYAEKLRAAAASNELLTYLRKELWNDDKA